MERCHDVRMQVLDLLRGPIAPELRAALDRHLAACPPCAREAAWLREAWQRVPAAADVAPPAALRAAVLAHARGEARQAPSVRSWIRVVANGFLAPVSLGAAAAFAVVILLHLRGAMAPLGHLEVVALSLFLAVALAGVLAAFLRSGAPRPVRALFGGALGSLGGYTLLTLASPIPDTVEVCRVAVLRTPTMTMGELCLTYLVVAALYAGIPVAVAAYVRSADAAWWRTGILEGALFTLLAAPILVLQSGLDEWLITGTVLTGLVLGAVAGGLLGSGARAWRVPRASGSAAGR